MIGMLIALSLLPSLSDTVIYEDNLRAEGPPAGFRSLERRLPSLKRLGVNVLWLMPVQPVGKLKSAGGLGSPYAVADYSKVNPEFGSASDFQSLVNTAHRANISVILDWVPNHTAWDNPWISARPDWYVHDAKGAIASPQNPTYNDVAKLDYRNPALRAAMMQAMQGWVDRYGIDGFRCDFAESEPIEFWRDTIASLRTHTPRRLLMLAEGYKPELYRAGFDLAYGWHFNNRVREIIHGRPATDLASAVAEEAEGVPLGARRLRFVTNHDKAAWEGSPLEQYGTTAAIRAAFALDLFYGGTPLVYSGQEVNWPRRIPLFTQSTIDWNSDPNTRAWMTYLLKLRASNPVLREGETSDESTQNVVVLHRHWKNQEAYVLVNVRAKSQTVTLSGKWVSVDPGCPFMGSLPGYSVVVLRPPCNKPRFRITD